jgi:hypothetical protein
MSRQNAVIWDMEMELQVCYIQNSLDDHMSDVSLLTWMNSPEHSLYI